MISEETIQTLSTPRWFLLPAKVRQHPIQKRLHKDLEMRRTQFFVIAAGRRSFKTERFIKRRFVRKGISQPGRTMFIGAPTYTQAQLIFWEDIKAMVPHWAMKDKSESEMFIEFWNGSKLWLFGLKEFQRIEGARWTDAAITEYQQIDPDFFPSTLQPILNDTGGEGILEGRPLGKNHFWETYNREHDEPERWASYHWPASDILTPAQIDAAMKDLAIEDFRREYDASFDADNQRVYFAYSAENHGLKKLQPSLPIVVTCDFNAGEKPMSWVVGQRFGEKSVYWAKTFQHAYTNTVTMCQVVDEWFGKLPSYPVHLIFYGDYSGKKQTSNSSFSDWEIIGEFFRNRVQKFEKRTKPCLSIRDRNASTNALLCNTKNERRMFVNPGENKPLMRDWESVERKSNGIDLEDRDPRRTHASDAVDYYSYYEHPIRPVPEGRQFSGRS